MSPTNPSRNVTLYIGAPIVRLTIAHNDLRFLQGKITMNITMRNNVIGNNGEAILAMYSIQEAEVVSVRRSIYLPPSALLIVKRIRNMHISVRTSRAAPNTLVDDGGNGGGCCSDSISSSSLSVVVVVVCILSAPFMSALPWSIIPSPFSPELFASSFCVFFQLLPSLLLLRFLLRLLNDRCFRYTTHAALVVIESGGGAKSNSPTFRGVICISPSSFEGLASQ